MGTEGHLEALRRANLAHRRGELESAERGYRAVLKAMPDQPDAVHFLGLLLHQRARDETAPQLLARAVELDPANPLYRHNLAGVLKERGEYAEAERRYREALTLKPDYVDAHLQLGLLHAARRDFPAALVCYDQALKLEPRFYPAWASRGEALFELARRDEALESWRKARELADLDPVQLQMLGGAFREAGEYGTARECHERALVLRPDDAQVHNSLGNALGMQGDFLGAERHYRQALTLRPGYAGALHNLSGITKLRYGDPLWPQLEALEARLGELPPAEAALVHFALGKVREDAREYAAAFRHYAAGNALKRASLRYDEVRQAGFFREFLRLFDADFLASRARAGSDDPRPVFIVGMPRSGTSLAEQILASHAEVYGAGEIHALRNGLRAELPATEDDYALPAQLAALDTAALARGAARYCVYLDGLAPSARRVTNKLPGNTALVGLVHLLFPHAVIVHCTRDARDTCLSNFTKLFTTGHAFSYDQGELGRFHRMYAELMVGWQRVLPAGRLYTLNYEALVEDFEGESRRLVAACGLAWDPGCLRFYDTPRSVKTASLAQVRQPVYASSVGRWKHYQQELAPLLAALSGPLPDELKVI